MIKLIILHVVCPLVLQYGACPQRGLVPNSERQTFQIQVRPAMREMYDRIRHLARSGQVRGLIPINQSYWNV